MQIRYEHAGDRQKIGDLLYTAFLNHPHHAPGAKPTEPKIVDHLREAKAIALSLVAEEEEQIVGYIVFSAVRVSGRSCEWYGLGPIAVLPDRQRQGIGSVLIEHGMEEMRARSASGIVLVGEQQFYSRFGFEPHSSLSLDGVPPEFFLALPLDSPVPSGFVTYHAAFSKLDVMAGQG